jgi:archaellin
MKWPFLLYLILFDFLAFSQCPTINLQPKSQTDCDGNSIRMISQATAGSSFQWERKRPQDGNYSIISGANLQAYQIFPSGDANSPTGTLYRVKVALNSCNLYSQAAEITLTKISSIINPSICERGSGVLEVQMQEISVSKAISYQWTRAIGGGNFQDLSDDANFKGSQSKNLTILNAPSSLQGQRFKIRIQYSITLNNDNEGSLNNENQVSSCPRTSNEVIITIKSSPQLVHSSSLYTGCLGAPISINSTGCSPYVTQWYDENENKLGTGAKIFVTQTDLNPKIYKATCLKLGCESLPSLGTSAQAFSVPAAPTNAGTPTATSLESSIIFKATGGTNNIWYLNENDIKAISTAATITVPVPINSGSSAIELVRWVSQKVNNCESSKTAIRVSIPARIQPIIPSAPTIIIPTIPSIPAIIIPTIPSIPAIISPTIPSNPTLTNPIIIPEGNTLPNVVPSDLAGLGSTEPTEPELRDLEVIIPPKEKLLLRYSTELRCEEASYILHVEGCPVPVRYNNLNGGVDYRSPGLDLLVFSPNETKISVICEGEFADPILVVLPGLKRPAANIELSFDSFVCENEIIEIKINYSSDSQFIVWEKEGHSYSENSIIKEIANAGTYQAIISKAGCFYRSEKVTVDVHKTPIPPLLFSPKKAICQQDSLLISIKDDAKKYMWTMGETTKNLTYVGKKAGIELFKAKITLDGRCWSEWSDPLKIRIHPTPTKPQIVTLRNAGFCRGDSTLLQTTKNAKSWKWSSSETKSFIYSKKPQTYTVSIQDSVDCWSPPSDPVTSFYFPIEKQPITKSFPSNQFCLGDFVTLKTSQAFGYLWNTGETTDSIKVNQSGKYQLKTKNEYGCWSIPSIDQFVYGRTLPLMPILEKTGTFFIKARNFDVVDSYQWIVGPSKMVDTNAILKMAVNGLHQVRAKRNFDLATNPLLSCYSEFQKMVFNIPENFNGFSIYPNPMIGNLLTIEILKETGAGEILLADLRGIILGTWPIENSKDALKIKIHSIPNGQYIIKMISANVILNKLLIINQ